MPAKTLQDSNDYVNSIGKETRLREVKDFSPTQAGLAERKAWRPGGKMSWGKGHSEKGANWLRMTLNE